jgi:hypothetical protein
MYCNIKIIRCHFEDILEMVSLGSGVIFVQVFKAEYGIIDAVVFLFYFEFASFG